TASLFFSHSYGDPRVLHSFPTRRSSDLGDAPRGSTAPARARSRRPRAPRTRASCEPEQARDLLLEEVDLVAGLAEVREQAQVARSEEHTSELQSLAYLVCRLLLEKKKQD